MALAIQQVSGKPRNSIKKIIGVQNVNVQSFDWHSTGHGMVGNWGTNWSTARSAGTGTVAYVGNEVYNQLEASTYVIYRLLMPFDTSALPDDCTVISAKLKCTLPQKSITTAQSLYTVASTQASNTTITTSDFGSVGSTDLGSIASSAMTQGVDFEINLNSTGIAAISKTSYTKLAFRLGLDFNNTPPTTMPEFIQTNVTLEITYNYNDTKKIAGVSNV